MGLDMLNAELLSKPLQAGFCLVVGVSVISAILMRVLSTTVTDILGCR